MSGAKISLAHKLCCSLQLYVQPWVVTLHFPQPSSYSHCFEHCNTVTMCGGFYLSLTGLVVSLSRLGTAAPSSPPSHTHTHCLRERKTHSCHTVSARQKGSHRPTPPRFSQLTVEFWFSRAGRSSHPSSLLTHFTSGKQDKRDFHIKVWRAHRRRLKLVALTLTQRHTLLAVFSTALGVGVRSRCSSPPSVHPASRDTEGCTCGARVAEPGSRQFPVMLKEHQHPAVRLMLCQCILCASERGTGDRVIRIVG